MAVWFYQLSEEQWSAGRFRLDVWEGVRWRWPVKTVQRTGNRPAPGDTVVFFYAKTGSDDPGFYGWAIVIEWYKNKKGDESMYFQPVAPTDLLKMFPWGDKDALQLADDIRGGMTKGTMWPIDDDNHRKRLRSGIMRWLNS